MDLQISLGVKFVKHERRVGVGLTNRTVFKMDIIQLHMIRKNTLYKIVHNLFNF